MRRTAIADAMHPSPAHAGDFCPILGLADTFDGLVNCTSCIVACEASGFNGVTDSRSFGLGNNWSDSKTGTLSFWFKIDGGDGAVSRFYKTSGTRFSVIRQATGKIQILGKNSAAANVLRMRTVADTYTADSVWKHLIASWDLAAATGWMYIDGVDVVDAAQPPIFTNDFVDIDDIGFQCPDSVDRLNGAMTEWWFDDAFTADTTANREKFRTAAGAPVALGANGETPFGASPLEYFTGGATDGLVNLGSGGVDMTGFGSISTVDGPGV